MIDLKAVATRFPIDARDLERVGPMPDLERLALERFLAATVSTGYAQQRGLAGLVDDFQALTLANLHGAPPPPLPVS